MHCDMLKIQDGGAIVEKLNWKNSKLYENTPPCGRRVSTQFLVFPISSRVDVTIYQYGKCFIFVKCWLEDLVVEQNYYCCFNILWFPSIVY